MSCGTVNVGPGVEVVNAGSTRVSVVSVARTASAGVVPSTRNASTWCRKLPASKHTPTTPLQMIITVAYTVSRANAVAAGPAERIIETIRDTSMIVTASASTSVPKGSPTRCAMTSAWCTAARTEASSAAAATESKSHPDELPLKARMTQAPMGTATLQTGTLLNNLQF